MPFKVYPILAFPILLVLAPVMESDRVVVWCLLGNLVCLVSVVVTALVQATYGWREAAVRNLVWGAVVLILAFIFGFCFLPRLAE
jgi:hypothetical protein